MGRPYKHRFKRPLGGGDGPCEGVVQGMYVRKGSGSGRWIKLGEMCLRCHTFWPVDSTATAEEIAARATPS